MKILLFGGTAEGRTLAEWLSVRGIALTVCVATEYGETLLPGGLDVRTGRMDQAEMERLMPGYTLAVDATHPYAAAVTGNIRAAADKVGLPLLRLLRGSDGEPGCLTAPDMDSAARLLETRPGNVLLTTGSKELDRFTSPELLARCYPRVLPMEDSLRRCLTLGFPPAHIVCMQGPFSKALNVAMLRQFDIKTMVTKDTGGCGGFREKLEAARETGCELLVVERPTKESGLSLEEIQAEIGRLA